MISVSTEHAQSRFSELLGCASQTPVEICDGSHPCVLVSADDWRAIQETLFLVSIPGMRESIREGMQTPLDECVESVW